MYGVHEPIATNDCFPLTERYPLLKETGAYLRESEKNIKKIVFT